MGTFNERFKSLRLEHKLTQDKIAELFFLNKSSISRYESGRQIPEPSALEKFAKFFDVSLDYLMGISDARHNAPKIDNIISSDSELNEFWNNLKNNETLQILYKETKDMDDKEIKQILRIIKAIEDEEANE